MITLIQIQNFPEKLSTIYVTCWYCLFLIQDYACSIQLKTNCNWNLNEFVLDENMMKTM